MKTLNAKQLKSMIDTARDSDKPVLLNVLSEEDFERGHIPGSHNVPIDNDSFLDDVKKIVDTKDQNIVVYCASRNCSASPKAAEKLTEAGYTNVMDFEDGMAGWKLAGYQAETAIPAAH